MKNKGYTLKELLVVIAIVALLIAILLPVVISARRNANVAPCMTNLRQLHVALAGYREDYSGEWPSLIQLSHYSNTKAILMCPTDKYNGANRRESRRSGIPISYFYPPSIRDYFRDLASVDPNHGVAVCVLHGDIKNPELLESNHFNAVLAFTGRVLRLRADGSVHIVRVPIKCWQDSTGIPSETRCLWDLFTDISLPELVRDGASAKQARRFLASRFLIVQMVKHERKPFTFLRCSRSFYNRPRAFTDI